MGGVETYTNLLMPIFIKNKWEVTEITTCYPKDELNFKPKKYKLVYTPNSFNNAKGIKFWPQFKKTIKDLDKFKKENKFDLIINNMAHGFRFETIGENEILIQHQTPWVYQFYFSGVKNNLISKITGFFSALFVGNKNRMLMHKTVLFYDLSNKKDAEQRFNFKYKNLPTLHLCPVSKKEVQNIRYEKNKSNIVYIGRINQFQKNIKFLVKIAKYLDCTIDVYGDGDGVPLLKNKKNINYCGVLKHDQALKTYSSHLACINVSKHEGECYSAIESLAAGTPCILRDTFCSSKELSKTGLLLDKKLSAKKCAKKINLFLKNLNAEQTHKKCQDQVLKKYTTEVFNNTWNDIIKNYEHYLHT